MRSHNFFIISMCVDLKIFNPGVVDIKELSLNVSWRRVGDEGVDKVGMVVTLPQLLLLVLATELNLRISINQVDLSHGT